MAPEKEVKDINFDNLNEDLEWEYVMLDTQIRQKDENDDDEGGDDNLINMQNS